MRVLLTGASGFVGRHIYGALLDRGDEVLAIDLDGTPFVQTGDALDFFRHDDTRFDLAIHAAAIVGGRASIDGSPLGVATNLALDAWYMRWLIRTGTPRAVYFSSSAAYPVALQQPGDVRRLYEEDINLQYMEEPDATYGWAKLTAEKLASYAEAEGCRILIPRPFSGYGEDQAPCYPFPAFIARAKRRDDPFEIWGSGRHRARQPRLGTRHQLRRTRPHRHHGRQLPAAPQAPGRRTPRRPPPRVRPQPDAQPLRAHRDARGRRAAGTQHLTGGGP